jgi:signal transduction histidine kinase
MSLRRRILIGTGLLTLLPLLAFFFGVRHTISSRFEARYRQQIESVSSSIDGALAGRSGDLGRTLTSLVAEITGDNALWLALVRDQDDQQLYLRSRITESMHLAGLEMLLLLDHDGKVLASGHYPQEHGRSYRSLALALEQGGDAAAVIQVRRASGFFPALIRLDHFQMADRRFLLLGGMALDVDFLRDLSGGSGLDITMLYASGEQCAPGLSGWLGTGPPLADPEAAVDSAGVAAVPPTEKTFIERRDLKLSAVGAGGRMYPARIVITHPRTQLDLMLGELSTWLLLTLLVALAGSLTLAVILAARISRPLMSLASKAEEVDFDRLDVDFSSTRNDEVGRLSRLLQGMTVRLSTGRRRLTEAERRATLGEVARQVTHDIRNGFTPLRNVISHLSQVARDEPEELPEIFRERLPTLESGLNYLEGLSSNYGRLSSRNSPGRCSLEGTIREILPPGLVEGIIEYLVDLEPDLPALVIDPSALRRILENLIRNARESLPDGGGTITVSGGKMVDEFGEPALAIRVIDTGCGISPEALTTIFDDFYTSKPAGSGLGLSNVRRLVTDLGGQVQVASEPGRGSTFTLVLPLETEPATPLEER